MFGELRYFCEDLLRSYFYLMRKYDIENKWGKEQSL